MKQTKQITVQVPDEPREVPRKKAYRIEEAAGPLSIGRTTAFALVKEGKLRARKIGDRLVISDVELDRFLAEECPEASPRPREAAKNSVISSPEPRR